MSTIQNKAHPEKQEDEVFITNCFKKNHFMGIGWQSKRKGETAYDANGRILHEGFPVFVKRSELEAAGFEIQEA